MTNIERLKVRIPEATEAELEDALLSAQDVILSRCFVSVSRTSEDDKAAALADHNEKILNAAVVIYNMRGVEGQVSHSENGVARTYADCAGMKPILEQITPRCDVV
jgi:hypothetical protein